jgi:hypothetical protein
MAKMHAAWLWLGLMLPAGGVALETGSAGLEGPKASAEALNVKMNSQAAAFNAALNKIQKCNTEGKFYDPTHTDPAPDADGCWSDTYRVILKDCYDMPHGWASSCRSGDAVVGTCVATDSQPNCWDGGVVTNKCCTPRVASSICSSSADCSDGEACINSACRSPRADGAGCQDNEQCASGYCDTVTHKCGPKPLLPNGQACQSNGECTSAYCAPASHKCAKYPKGLANGKSCTAAGQCAGGYCVASVCADNECGTTCPTGQECAMDYDLGWYVCRPAANW